MKSSCFHSDGNDYAKITAVSFINLEVDLQHNAPRFHRANATDYEANGCSYSHCVHHCKVIYKG